MTRLQTLFTAAAVLLLMVSPLQDVRANPQLLFPFLSPADYETGEDYIVSKDYADALEFFSRELEKDPDNPIPRVYLGITHFLVEDFGAAARETVMAANLHNSILSPNNDLKLEIGWIKNIVPTAGKSIAFIPRYRIDDQIRVSGNLKVKCFWEEKNEVIRQQDSAQFKLLITIKSHHDDGLFPGVLRIERLNFSHSLAHIHRSLARKDIHFLFSPVFGFIRLVNTIEFSEGERDIAEALLRAIFPSFPPQYLKPDATTTALEYGNDSQSYIGISHFEHLKKGSATLYQKLQLYPPTDNLLPTKNFIERELSSYENSSLLEKITCIWQKKSDHDEKDRSNIDQKYDVTTTKISYKRGMVELPLFPANANVSENIEIADISREESSTEQIDPFQGLIYQAPEVTAIENQTTATPQNSLDNEASAPPQHTKSVVDQETRDSNHSSLVYIPPDTSAEETVITKGAEEQVIDDTATETIITQEPEKSTTSVSQGYSAPPVTSEERISGTELRSESESANETVSDQSAVNYDELIIETIPQTDYDSTSETESMERETDDLGDQGQQSRLKMDKHHLELLLKKIELPPPHLAIDALEQDLAADTSGARTFYKEGKDIIHTATALPESDLLIRGVKIAEAKKKFRQAIETAGKKAAMCAAVGTILFNNSLYSDALETFQQGLNSSKTAELYAGTALTYAAMNNKLVKAIVLAKKAINKSKTSQNQLILGWIYLKKGYYQWALEVFEEVRNDQNIQSGFQFYRGYAHLGLNEIDMAKVAFREYENSNIEPQFMMLIQEIRQAIPKTD